MELPLKRITPLYVKEMALRNLRYSDESILRKKAKEVKEIDNKVWQLLDDMKETLEDIGGLGLAAPQIGVLKRVAIILYDGEEEETEEADETEERETQLFELINPVIVEQTGVQKIEEACLSITDKKGVVERPAFVRVKALNRHGEEFEITGEGLLARALCHELDHLDGVLFIDKAVELYDKNASPSNDDGAERVVKTARKGKRRR